MLREPVNVGKLQLKNRLVMPPLATRKAEADGLVSDALCEYYDEKSKGGYIGLLICEHSFVMQEGKSTHGQMSMADDAVIPGLRRLTEIVHNNGCKFFAQINHVGGAASSAVTGLERVSASSVLMLEWEAVPDRVLSESDIEGVVAAFAAAAGRVKAAGFDGVEIHSAHGYLLNQFYSPLSNRRGDRYTGSTIEGRTRLQLEVIKAVRDTVGEDYPVAIRLGACDYAEGGTTVEDSVLACAEFEKAGVDLIDISGGFCGYFARPGVTDQGYFSEISQQVRKAVSVPVILTGGITEASAAERLLREEKADLIGVGRAMLKDSDWARKAMS